MFILAHASKYNAKLSEMMFHLRWSFRNISPLHFEKTFTPNSLTITVMRDDVEF